MPDNSNNMLAKLKPLLQQIKHAVETLLVSADRLRLPFGLRGRYVLLSALLPLIAAVMLMGSRAGDTGFMLTANQPAHQVDGMLSLMLREGNSARFSVEVSGVEAAEAVPA